MYSRGNYEYPFSFAASLVNEMVDVGGKVTAQKDNHQQTERREISIKALICHCADVVNENTPDQLQCRFQ